jgi:RNA polymerase sigma-70 factor (ECF subfamily)
MNAPATLLTRPVLADRDQRLLDTARNGDLDAFEALVRRHQRKVYSLAWHGVRDQMAAEEIAQDVFMQLHAALPRIESGAHLCAWLRRTTTHRVIDALRVRKSSRSIDQIAEPHVQHGIGDPFAERLVHRALARLAPRARMVVMLRYMDDLAPTEIAETLDMSLNTVKSHLRRGMLVLRARLQREPTR